MQKIVALLALIMVTGLLAGCTNTVNGAGQDIEKMGEWMQESV